MDNDYRISVRTMDLGSGTFDVVTRPSTGAGVHGYVGFVPRVIIDVPAFVTGGLNDAGLSCDMQTLVGTAYPPRDPHKTLILSEELCSWALAGFDTVADVEHWLRGNMSVVGVNLLDQHWVLRDAGGASLVVEFMDHSMQLYSDLNDGGVTGYGVMTNEPPFPYHLANIKHLQWKRTLARQSVPVPGTWYPEDRFTRAYMVKSGMAAPKTYAEAVVQAIHVLNTVTVPMGNQYGTDSGSTSGEGVGDHTLYGVVYDHLNTTLYWRTDVNQNMQRVRLKDLLKPGAKRLALPSVNNGLPWFNDASSHFTPE